MQSNRINKWTVSGLKRKLSALYGGTYKIKTRYRFRYIRNILWKRPLKERENDEAQKHCFEARKTA
jgi:hypothetical protein